MRTKKPFLYIAAGLITAVIAVFFVNKRLSQAQSAPVQDSRVPLLLATRDLGYGEKLVLAGEGQEGNCRFVSWPKDVVPAGAIKDREKVTDQHLRARTEIAKHELILERRVANEEDFIPEDMVPERVGVNKADIKSGLFRPGMKVDILRIVGKNAVEFMRSVRVYAVGRLDLFGHPTKDDDVDPNVFVLIRKDQRVPFIEASLSGSFRLIEASMPDLSGPVMVEHGGSPEARLKQARAKMENIKRLLEAGDPGKALSELEVVTEEFGDLESVATDAAVLAGRCRQAIAADLLAAATHAFEVNKQYDAAAALLDQIERQTPDLNGITRQVAELRSKVNEAIEEQQRLSEYRELLSGLEKALSTGDLPAADEAVAGLEGFAASGFSPGGDLTPPAEALAEYSARLRRDKSEYDLDKRVLESYLKRGSVAQAREKLQQMKERFPGHPEIAQLENAVKQSGVGNQASM